MSTLSASGASQKTLRAIELFDAAMASHTDEALDAYLDCFHQDGDLTAAYGGMAVTVSGVGELRKAIENLFAAGLSHACHDVRVVTEEPAHAVAHSTRVIFQDGGPLISVEVECDVMFTGDLISKMIVRERALSADAPVAWVPLGPTLSFSGEIVARGPEEKLLVRFLDGRESELSAPAEAQRGWDVGDPVIVFFDGSTPLGWYLPECQLGVDLRGSGVEG